MVETKNDVTSVPSRSGRIRSGAWYRDYTNGSAAVVGMDRGSTVLGIDENGKVQIVDTVIDELSEVFSSTLALANSPGWERSEFDRRFDEAKAGGSKTVERANMIDASKEWQELGYRLGFDGVLDDLAVILSESNQASDDGEWLCNKIKDVVNGLSFAGYTHVAIAVVASDLSHVLENRIFEAGAQVLEVPKDFFTFGADVQRSFIKSLFPPAAMRLPDPAPASNNPDADPKLYISRNPDLSEEDVADWWRRLAAPLGKD